METLPDLATILNGGISAFNLFVLYRLKNIEKDLERERKYLKDFQDTEQETNKGLDARLRKIEFKLAKIWSNFT